MAQMTHARTVNAFLSRQASGDLILKDDDDQTRVGAVEITLWADAAQGTGGIAVMNPAGTWAKHFDLPSTIMSPLLEAVFRPDTDESE
jgi:hypothetical protein